MPVHKMIRLFATCVVASLFWIGIGENKANAGFKITADQGAATYSDTKGGTVEDGFTFADFGSFTVGSYRVTASSSFSNAPGTAEAAILNVSLTVVRLNPSNTSTTPLNIKVVTTSPNFTQPSSPVYVNGTSTFNFDSGTVNAQDASKNLTTTGYIDNTPTNTLTSNYQLQGGSFEQLKYAYVGEFSLGLAFTINLAPPKSLSTPTSVGGNATLVVTLPAPATAYLALAGAPVLALFGWKRRRKMEPTPSVA